MKLAFLLLATLVAGGPLPQKTGMVHHHHQHHKYKEAVLVKRATLSLSLTTLTTLTKTLSLTLILTTLKLTLKLTSKTTTASTVSASSDAMPKLTSTTEASSESSSATTTHSGSSSELTTSMSLSSEMPSLTSSDYWSSEDVSTSSATVSTTSYSYSIAIPPSTNTNNYIKNPYVYVSLLPDGLVFVIVGSILGLVLLILLAYRTALWIISRTRAKNEKAVYFGNWDNMSTSSASFLLGGSLLSLLEKGSTIGSNSSIMMLQRNSVALNHELNWETTTQGRSYREMTSDVPNRGSMYISPVLELMKSRSNLDLPLLHPGDLSLGMDSPSTGSMSTPQEKKRERPPSQILDDLLDGLFGDDQDSKTSLS